MKDYIKIARPDHWIKNLFIFPGTLFALLLVGWQGSYGGLAVPRGQRAAAAVRSVRGGGLSCLSVSGQKHCAQKEPPGAAAGTISAVGRQHRGLVRHELQVLWPFYHQRFHFQRIQ